ncbi:MAG: AEC family transporter, partial [Pseudomonadota bacterium]
MSVFSAIFPVVTIASLGYASRRFNWLTASEAETLERIAFNFLIPCLLFLGTATAEFPADMDWHFLFAFYLVVVLVYLIGMAIAAVLFRYNIRELSVFGMGGAYSNVTVLGVPITLELLGDQALVPMFIIISLHNLLIYSFGTVLAECRNEGGRTLLAHLRRVLQDMLLNPISSSLLAGAIFNLLGFTLFAPVEATLDMLSRAAVPGAVFALGAALTRYHVRGEIGASAMIVVLKLLVMPGLMWIVMRFVFDIREDWLQTAVILSCMPVGISVYVFSRRYQSGETAAAAAIVLSSLMAIVPISFYSWVLGI